MDRVRCSRAGRPTTPHGLAKKSKSSPRRKTVYLVTSADRCTAPPTTLATWVREHWGIENKLYHVRNITYDEDRSQIRTEASPQVMATLRNLAINLLHDAGWHNITAATRHMVRDETDPSNSYRPGFAGALFPL